MKKNILGLFAIAIAVAFSAFTVTPRFADPSFELTEGLNAQVSANYFEVSALPTCNDVVEVCYIIAPKVPGSSPARPDLTVMRTQGATTQSISAWINQALTTGTPNNFVKLEP